MTRHNSSNQHVLPFFQPDARPAWGAAAADNPGASSTAPGRADTVMTLAHAPDRPSWNCSVCGRAWPCDAARAGLTQAFAGDRRSLGMYLGGHLIDAIDDGVSAPLYDRIVAWLRGPS